MKQNNARNNIEIEILKLVYNRYLSRGHTIFTTTFEIFSAAIFGVIGLIISLVQIGYIPEFNKYYFVQTIIYTSLFLIFVGSIALHQWYDSRVQRKKIINNIRLLGQKL